MHAASTLIAPVTACVYTDIMSFHLVQALGKLAHTWSKKLSDRKAEAKSKAAEAESNVMEAQRNAVEAQSKAAELRELLDITEDRVRLEG